jgi:hypothetical protein
LCCETAQQRTQQPTRPRSSVRCCPAPCQSSKYGRRGLKLGSWLAFAREELSLIYKDEEFLSFKEAKKDEPK